MTEKLWGWTETLFSDGRTQVDRIIGRAGGASSLHLHRGKSNLFFVQKGVLDVFVGGGLFRRLTADESVCIPANVKHRMAFVTDCEAVEVYCATDAGVPLVRTDIVRFDTGWKPGECPTPQAV